MSRMHIKKQYEPLAADRHYIDKTEALEKGIAVFPSIYIEGAAASGKTTAVKLFLRKHPQAQSEVFWMDEEAVDPAQFAQKLRRILHGEMHSTESEIKERDLVVFENLSSTIPAEMIHEIVYYLRHMSSDDRALLIGRDRPAEEFLELIWKREMQIIPSDAWLFSKEEVMELTEASGSRLNPDILYKVTGGWPGCVDLMLRMSLENPVQDVHELRSSYEIDTYIRRQILDLSLIHI